MYEQQDIRFYFPVSNKSAHDNDERKPNNKKMALSASKSHSNKRKRKDLLSDKVSIVELADLSQPISSFELPPFFKSSAAVNKPAVSDSHESISDLEDSEKAQTESKTPLPKEKASEGNVRERLQPPPCPLPPKSISLKASKNKTNAPPKNWTTKRKKHTERSDLILQQSSLVESLKRQTHSLTFFNQQEELKRVQEELEKETKKLFELWDNSTNFSWTHTTNAANGHTNCIDAILPLPESAEEGNRTATNNDDKAQTRPSSEEQAKRPARKRTQTKAEGKRAKTTRATWRIK